MNLINILTALILVASIHAQIHPSPTKVSVQDSSLRLEEVCNIFHQASHHELVQSQYYFNKITKRLNQNIECHRPLVYNAMIHTPLQATEKKSLKAEAYEITINESGIQLAYGDYSGYVYAMETLAQLLKKALLTNELSFVKIEDEPRFQHRGIMIDTSRHFLQVSTIQRLIQNMPLSKLNILHWHMIDDESFPVELGLHPELAQAGSYGSGKIYSIDNIKALISLAGRNGVKIVPEVQSPAHMRSWVLSPSWNSKNLTIDCTSLGETGKYTQQIDPTKSQAVQLVKEVLTELDNLFKTSPYIHLGGNRISYFCWDSRKEIASYMKLHNIKSYDALVQNWRYNLKQILPSSRKVIYWADQDHSYSVSPNDILQFKGNTSDLLSFMEKTQNKFILSPFNISDLTAGLGNLWLNSSNYIYNTWREIYEGYGKLISQLDTTRVLGAELLLWGVYTNDDNFDNNVWMRAAVFGERMWSTNSLPTYEIVASIVAVQRILEEAGVDVSPITSEYCEYKPQVCWPENLSEINSLDIKIQ